MILLCAECSLFSHHRIMLVNYDRYSIWLIFLALDMVKRLMRKWLIGVG